MSKYSVSLQDMAEMFKALSNPHRLALFKRLMSCCEPGTRCRTDQEMRCCVGDLGQDVDIAPSTLSHHLKELNRAGLVRMQRNGKHVECWVEPDVVNRIGDFFNL
ncbi:MAG: winged helix-turn-helix transcriptional regulator [Thiogranum sp.]|nr:winged helix-turn-helix transcriptional regulator [Thiogranum sp.]